MSIKQESSFANGNSKDICFGLDRITDEQSLGILLTCFSQPALLGTLVPRLSDEEIKSLEDHLVGLMHTHLSHKEYHSLFLKD